MSHTPPIRGVYATVQSAISYEALSRYVENVDCTRSQSKPSKVMAVSNRVTKLVTYLCTIYLFIYLLRQYK
jgi:hypothetical protein